MARPPGPPEVRARRRLERVHEIISVRLPYELRIELDEEAERRGVSRNAVTVEAIREALR